MNLLLINLYLKKFIQLKNKHHLSLNLHFYFAFPFFLSFYPLTHYNPKQSFKCFASILKKIEICTDVHHKRKFVYFRTHIFSRRRFGERVDKFFINFIYLFFENQYSYT